MHLEFKVFLETHVAEKPEISQVINNLLKIVKRKIQEESYELPVFNHFLGKINYITNNNNKETASVYLTNVPPNKNQNFSSKPEYYTTNGAAFVSTITSNVKTNKRIDLQLSFKPKILKNPIKYLYNIEDSNNDELLQFIKKDMENIIYHEIAHQQNQLLHKERDLQGNDYQKFKQYSLRGNEWDAETTTLVRIYQNMSPQQKANTSYRDLIKQSLSANVFLRSPEAFQKIVNILVRKGIILKN